MSLIAAIAMSAATCALPLGWDQVAATGRKYVIFGEMHGTEQSPAMVGGVACASARRNERVLVAVELDSREDDGLQAAWGGPHQGFRERLLVAMPNWKGRNDGVASRAMLAMLDDLHALKAQGMSIDVVAFNGSRGPEQTARFKHLLGQEPHEAAQAENIRRAADAARYDRVLVLVGNLHARKRPVERRAVSWKPMAMQLAPADQIVSLNMVSGAGTMWNCRLKPGYAPKPGQPFSSAAIACGAIPTRSDGAEGAPQIGLGPISPVELDPAYDGHFYVGPVTASAPASPGVENEP